MKIKNINGTSQYTCRCGSWIEHWEKFSGQRALYCAGIGCMEMNPIGAHVQKADGYDSNWYIVPLCNKHNLGGGELEIPDGTALVSANRTETCGN